VETSGALPPGVSAHALERIELFTDPRPVRVPTLPIAEQGFPGEAGDVFFCFGHGGAQRFIGFERRHHQFRLRHGELAGSKPGPVEFFGELQQCVVTAGLNGVEDDAGALLNDRIEQAGRRSQLAELGGKIRVGMADNFHAGRLGNFGGKVKIHCNVEPVARIGAQRRHYTSLRKTFLRFSSAYSGMAATRLYAVFIHPLLRRPGAVLLRRTGLWLNHLRHA